MASTSIAAAGVAASDLTSAVGSSGPQSLTSTLASLKHSTGNISQYLTPSPKDLFMVFPRLIKRGGSFVLFTVPEQIDHIFGRGYGGSVIAEATGGDAASAAAAAASHAAFAQGAADGSSAAAVAARERIHSGGLTQVLSFQNVRGFGGVFTYLTSRWALCCFAMAIILNRTQVYASSRRHLTLNWQVRFLLRAVPIILFLYQIRWLLQAMHCQTSPEYLRLRYGSSDRQLPIDFATDSGVLHTLSSVVLWWPDSQQTCSTSHMIPQPSTSAEQKTAPVTGSLALLWPLFETLCLSHFVENLSCALQGRIVQPETGMTIFEHSLAFAEAEAMITNQLGWGPFGPSRVTSAENKTDTSSSRASVVDAISRTSLLDQVNTPPEVLLIGLISSLNHLSSHVLGVIGLQARFRLVNTAVWGLCFMGAFIWSFLTFAADPVGDNGILRFPTVCIVGFIPHLLVLIGILVCGSIYALALTMTALSPPPGLETPNSFKDRIRMAHENLQANMQLSNIRISMQEDFYTTLLKIGFMALTAASEAVYLNEGRAVAVRRWTWLEADRMNEIERGIRNSPGSGAFYPQDLDDGLSSAVADGVGLTEEKSGQGAQDLTTWRSGFARERRTQKVKNGGKGSKTRLGREGIGTAERSGRWALAWEFLYGIFSLIGRWFAVSVLKLLSKIGVTWRPQWLNRLGTMGKTQEKSRDQTSQTMDPLDYWVLSEDGKIKAADETVDVEAEERRFMQQRNNSWGEEQERELDQGLYSWWLRGGWWGERDDSGDFESPEREDDTTSVITTSSASESGWETDGEDDSGRRTPTRDDPFPRSRSPTPFTDVALDAAHLARLLNPRTPEQREESRVLAHHLGSERPLTRAQFQRAVDRERARVLTSSRYRPKGFVAVSPTGKLTGQEEVDLLEWLILSRREEAAAAASASNHGQWKDGAEGLGAGGPQCVVCQSAPRTILVWPCRCLSLCEDCRVSLAMNNFGNCVCCRRDVVGFSRLYVP